MKEVVLKVHPLSRGVLLSEYGCIEPLVIRQNDLVFPLLTSAPLQEFSNSKRAIPFLTATVTMRLHSEVANWLFTRPFHAGALLFKMHKDQMCRYAQASVKRGGDAWTSIQEWLYLHGVDEDAYSMEAAYKYWQRWNIGFREKNPQFFSRIRQKASVKTAKKMPESICLKMSLPPAEIDQALEEMLLRLQRPGKRRIRVPKRFPGHARAYLYRELGGLSEREAASVLGMNRSSVGYACRSMRNWIKTDARIRRALAETGLPQCA